MRTRLGAEIAGEIAGPVGMARSDPGTGLERPLGYGTQTRALSRARHVPFEVPTRMTCVTRTRADGSERRYITEAEQLTSRGGT